MEALRVSTLTGHRAIDDFRVDSLDRLVIETKAFELARKTAMVVSTRPHEAPGVHALILNKDIAFLDQLVHQIDSSSLL